METWRLQRMGRAVCLRGRTQGISQQRFVWKLTSKQHNNTKSETKNFNNNKDLYKTSSDWSCKCAGTSLFNFLWSCFQHLCSYCVCKLLNGVKTVSEWGGDSADASTKSHFVCSKFCFICRRKGNQQPPPPQLLARFQLWQEADGLRLAAYRAQRGTSR